MKKQTAFSLIEISIVILIIGVLVAGVIQANNFFGKFSLQTAQNLTKNSPVTSIKDLVAWYETTSETSFDDVELIDGGLITNWYDLNTQTTSKNNAVAASTGKSIYVKNALNSLPVLRFSGNSDVGYDISNLKIGNEITAIIVASNADNVSTIKRILSNQNYLFIGYRGSRQFAAHYGDGSSWNHSGTFGSDATLTLNKYYILSTTLNSAGINKGYVSGLDVGSPTFTPETKASSTGISIGRGGGATQVWNGDIAEIIIFDRALRNSERTDIEKYLSKKWGIPLS